MKAAAILFSFLCVGIASARRACVAATPKVAAFASPRASWVGGRGAGRDAAVTAASRSRAATAVNMIDLNVVIGVGVGVAGLGAGAGIVWWTERAGTIAEERGSSAMSEETKNRMAGMFMEDVELSAGLDDVVTRMEKAMAEAEGVAVEDLEGRDVKREVEDDGW
mmetsp:Transcript_36644/g.63346  ORF Transcript_36644/g.63346 Transcript_36644/m.63346 type:complete len:165 (-) Transcript_36644:138-632(-)